MTINMTRSSKITVECTGMSARQLPVGIDRVTQVMVMMVMVVIDGHADGDDVGDGYAAGDGGVLA